MQTQDTSLVLVWFSSLFLQCLQLNWYVTNTVENLVVVLVNPFAPKMSLVILLTVCYSILINCICKFGEFGIGSANYPLVDILH